MADVPHDTAIVLCVDGDDDLMRLVARFVRDELVARGIVVEMLDASLPVCIDAAGLAAFVAEMLAGQADATITSSADGVDEMKLERWWPASRATDAAAGDDSHDGGVELSVRLAAPCRRGPARRLRAIASSAWTRARRAGAKRGR